MPEYQAWRKKKKCPFAEKKKKKNSMALYKNAAKKVHIYIDIGACLFFL